MRILYCALDEIPHLLAFFSIDSLLNVPHLIVLLLCLCVNEIVSQVYLPEPFGLILELCFSNLAVSETVFLLLHGQFVWGLYAGPFGEADYIANILGFSLPQSNQL